MTYSIVARDPATGQLGVAIQSHWFSVGSLAIAGAAGAGVITTQANPNTGYKPAGLALLKAGKSAQETVRALLEGDPSVDHRQLAAVDAEGRAAAFTGTACIAEAGHLIGDGYAVQANLMRSAAVWPAIADAYEAADGPLPERLLAALDAGEEAGGDLRGRQSAAVLVVPAEGSDADTVVDLRVEDASEPLTELRRLVGLQRAYALADQADALLARGDRTGAAGDYVAAHALAPANDELRFWAALGLIGAGAEDRGLELLRQSVAGNRAWWELLPRVEHVAPASARALDLLRTRGLRD